MKINELLEAVIDKSDLFRKKQVSRTLNQIQAAVDDFGPAIAQQEENEGWVNQRLKEIQRMPNRKLSKYKLQLAPLLKYYKSDTSILKILGWAYDDQETYQPNEVKMAQSFVQKHINEIVEILMEQKLQLEGLAIEADKKHWVSPWRRYTQYPYISLEIERTLQNFLKIQKTLIK